ncbi:hypothetical protein I4U23_019508 [Adineta vaga]|nr:hypothetical protein I4U23_019508 [Adineta vaga]
MNIDLTQPEILTIEQLQTHLIKFIGSDITNDKYELIQLFYKYIVPLPQRTFRTNRLGTILTNNQQQFGSRKQPISSDSKNTEKICIIKRPSAVAVDRVIDKNSGEKHESDRGIYTITMQKSGNKNTAPIKLKRSPPTITTNDEHDVAKRIKLDDTNT